MAEAYTPIGTYRTRFVRESAPQHPACFSARGRWVEYLVSAAQAQRNDHAPGPLVLEAGEPVRFNKHFDFCDDCTPEHRREMRALGKCNPKHLKEISSRDHQYED